MNHIVCLKTTQGYLLMVEEHIQREIIDFYKGLLGTATETTKAIHPEIIKNVSVLMQEQHKELLSR